MADKPSGTTAVSEFKSKRELDPAPGRTGADRCGHANPMLLRLIEYTRYGTWIGCVECGTSWLIRIPSQAPVAPMVTGRSAGTE